MVNLWMQDEHELFLQVWHAANNEESQATNENEQQYAGRVVARFRALDRDAFPVRSVAAIVGKMVNLALMHQTIATYNSKKVSTTKGSGTTS